MNLFINPYGWASVVCWINFFIWNNSKCKLDGVKLDGNGCKWNEIVLYECVCL